MEESTSQKMSERKGLVLRVQNWTLTLTGQRKVEGGKGGAGCVGIKEVLRLERGHHPNGRVITVTRASMRT